MSQPCDDVVHNIHGSLVLGTSCEDGEVALEGTVNLHACEEFALFLGADNYEKKNQISDEGRMRSG